MEKDPTVEKWSVLIVDDEVDNLGVPEGILSFSGATVKTAVNASDGLKLLEDWLPTFVLLDLAMPNMDGWQMHKLLRKNERTKDLAVIALTAHAMLGDKQRVLDAGFDGYISKPIDIDRFVGEIKEWLGRREAQRAASEKPADAATESAESAAEKSPAPEQSSEKPAPSSPPSSAEGRVAVTHKVLDTKQMNTDT